MALTKFNFNSFDVTTAASSGLGFNASANGFATIGSTSMVLIKTLTASDSANLAFVDGTSDVVLDNTYPLYVFKLINIHPATKDASFGFNMSIDSGSNYNVTKTSTMHRAYNNEGGGTTAFQYNGSRARSQSTADQLIMPTVGNNNDESGSGTLHLFNPSSTTFVKNFMCLTNVYEPDADFTVNYFCGGYGNTASAIDAVRFQMDSGNIDSGTIKLYGIKDS